MQNLHTNQQLTKMCSVMFVYRHCRVSAALKSPQTSPSFACACVCVWGGDISNTLTKSLQKLLNLKSWMYL